MNPRSTNPIPLEHRESTIDCNTGNQIFKS